MRSFDHDDPRSRLKKNALKWSGSSQLKGYNGFPAVPRKARSDTPRVSACRRWERQADSPEPMEEDLEDDNDEHDVAEALFCLSNMAAAVKEPKPKVKRIETAIDKKRKKMQLPPKHEDEEEYDDDSDTEDAKSVDETSDIGKSAGHPVPSIERKPKLAFSIEKKPKLTPISDKKPKLEPVEPSPSKCPRGPTKPIHKGNSPRKAGVLKAPDVPKVEPPPPNPKKDPRPSQDVPKPRSANGKDKPSEAAPSPAPPPPAVRPAARPTAPPAAQPVAPPPAPRAAPAVAPPVPDHLRRPWKRCAAHVYIAHFIDWQQNMKRDHTSKNPTVPWTPPPFHFNLPGFNEARARPPKPSSSPRKPAGGVSTPKKGGPSGRASSSKAPPPELNGGGGGGHPGSSRGGGGMGPPSQPSMSEQQRYASQLQQLAIQQQLQGGSFPFPFAGGMPGFPPGGPYPQHHGSGGMPPGASHPSFYGGQPPLGLGLHHMGPHPSGAVHLGMEGGKAHKGDPRDPGAAELARRFASSAAAQQEMLAKHGQPPGLDRGGFPMGADMKHLTPEMIYGMVNAANGQPPRGMPPHGQEHRMRSLYGSGEPPHGFRTKGHA